MTAKPGEGFARPIETECGWSIQISDRGYFCHHQWKTEQEARAVANLICSAHAARVQPLVKALEDIIKHQERLAGNLAGFGSTVQIAKKALEDFKNGR